MNADVVLRDAAKANGNLHALDLRSVRTLLKLQRRQVHLGRAVGVCDAQLQRRVVSGGGGEPMVEQKSFVG